MIDWRSIRDFACEVLDSVYVLLTGRTDDACLDDVPELGVSL